LAVFRDVRINDETTFGVDDGGKYGPKCWYDYDPKAEVSVNNDTHRLQAAVWTYRRLESFLEENAMDERARKAHICKEEVQRAKYEEKIKEDFPLVRTVVQPYQRVKSVVSLPRSPRLRFISGWAVSSLNWHLHRHGESLQQLLIVSFGLIGISGIVYSIGGVARQHPNTVHKITSFSELRRPEAYLDLANGLYFSIITFTTIGYGDFYPASPLSRVMVAFESFAGALLMALFVFVIGRQVAR
jgi:hypothetical protein